MKHHRKPPSRTWRTFLDNHVTGLASIDFFTVPTITFRILYVFIVLNHDPRRIVYFNFTAHPTTEWTAQQLVEAFPFDTVSKYFVQDRDGIYGDTVRRRIKSLSMEAEGFIYRKDSVFQNYTSASPIAMLFSSGDRCQSSFCRRTHQNRLYYEQIASYAMAPVFELAHLTKWRWREKIPQRAHKRW